MSLQGADDLRRRLAAISKAPEEVQRRWAVETVPILRARIPIRTGETARSVQPGSRPGTIIGSKVVNFLDAGTRAHDITARDGVLKFSVGNHTLFRKKVHKPRQSGRPFKVEAERQGLEKVDPQGIVVKLWNGAVA